MLARVARTAAGCSALERTSLQCVWRARQTPVTVRRYASKTPSAPPNEVPPPAGRMTKAMVVHELKEIFKLVVGGTVVIVTLVATSGYVIETTKQWNPMPAPGTFVDIEDDQGRPVSVHLQKKGSGEFTVVFDGGVGETSFDWDKVAEQVAKFATVVSIDRPGLGFSPPGPLPRTASQIAREYVEVLKKLDISNRVILVAHGAGGYNMRQLADELRSSANTTALRCEGLVLVDALQEELRGELESVSPVVKESLETMDANGETVLTLSRFGIIRMINNIQRKKFVDRYSALALPYVEYFLPSPAHRQGALWENTGIPLTEERLQNAPLSARGFAFPCVVLSHGKPDMFDGMKADPRVDLNTVAAMERKWQAAQQKLIDSVSTQPSVHIIVRDAGHNIQHEHPDEVARVVRALVSEAQESGSRDGLSSL